MEGVDAVADNMPYPLREWFDGGRLFIEALTLLHGVASGAVVRHDPGAKVLVQTGPASSPPAPVRTSFQLIELQ